MCPRCKRSMRAANPIGPRAARRDPVDRVHRLPARAARRGGRSWSPSCCATPAARCAMVDVPGEAPSVLADFPGPGPTVLLYAHYDVQPAPPDGWDTDPFAPTSSNGRLYGRGAADDKSGIAAHLAALRAYGGKPPVHVKVLIEGSEENGRQKLLEVVDRDPELMRADVIVVADNGNWKVGEPTLSLTLRGHGKLDRHAAHARGRAAQRPLRRRRAGRAAGAHPPDRHAPRRRRQRRGPGPRGRRVGRRGVARGGLPAPGRACSTASRWSAAAGSPTASGRATRSRSSASTRRRSRARATS